MGDEKEKAGARRSTTLQCGWLQDVRMAGRGMGGTKLSNTQWGKGAWPGHEVLVRVECPE